MFLETLENRLTPSTTLVDNTLVVTDAQIVSVDRVGDTIQVTENGVVTSFDSALVQSLNIQGDKNTQNVIQNNTSLDSVITGGNHDDTLFGGTGNNTIDGGKGDDIIYALLGSNTISSEGNGKDKIFTNFPANVTADTQDLVVRFFRPGRTPGVPFIGVEDGVLYITPSNNGSSVVIDSVDKNTISVTYDLGDGNGLLQQTFDDVKAISYFGGAGNDLYMNNTEIVEAAYGSAGNDVLFGNLGDFSLLKGSGGNDVLYGRAKTNDLSGNGGADTLSSVGNNDVYRYDLSDTLVGVDKKDVLISP